MKRPARPELPDSSGRPGPVTFAVPSLTGPIVDHRTSGITVLRDLVMIYA